jgi:hypothetical protein
MNQREKSLGTFQDTFLESENKSTEKGEIPSYEKIPLNDIKVQEKNLKTVQKIKITQLLRFLTLRSFSGADVLMLTCLLVYAFFFFKGIAPFWFNPEWSTDDALQQSYPFHKIFNPDIFKNDIITQMMEGYLTPLHYWITWIATFCSGDPVMGGHYVMLLQLVLTLIGVFFAVYIGTGKSKAPAFFALLWLFHTRHVMQRLTGGLPRGWAAPLLSLYLAAFIGKCEKTTLVLLFIGCLLHPPSTIIVGLSYGIYVFIGMLYQAYVQNRTRSDNELFKPFLRLLLLSPLFILTAWFTVRMPETIGTMADYQRALSMPEFQNPGGRFPFVPLTPLLEEVHTFGFQSFLSRLYRAGKFLEILVPGLVIVFTIIFFTVTLVNTFSVRRKFFSSSNAETTEHVTLKMISYLTAIIVVYILSRILAFKLYVPNRHLQFPMAFFFIVSFSLFFWNFAIAIAKRKSKKKAVQEGFATDKRRVERTLSFIGTLSLCVPALLFFVGSGHGLYGPANFNSSLKQKGNIYLWIRNHTPQNSLVAGFPETVDGVPLYSARQVYLSNETAHPFYDKYYEEVKRRMKIVLNAHYAKDLQEFLSIVQPEKIDYFVFRRDLFYPNMLADPPIFLPFHSFVTDITSKRGVSEYAYKELPKQVDLKTAPYMPFKDSRYAIVNVGLLAQIKSNPKP